jgi:hypothetical protein
MILSHVRFLLSLIAASLWAWNAVAAPMEFRAGGNDIRCSDCAFIQGTGEITEDTPKALISFLEKTAYAPRRLRLHSPGGNLIAAIMLGELLRERRFATEVGSDSPDPDNSPAFGGRASKREPGECASACAYAFFGGDKRVVEAPSRLGLHRFYHESAIDRPTEPLFSSQDLDTTQRMTAALAFYLVKMGLDARLLAIGSQAGPDEMYWLTPRDLQEFRVVYDADAWKPWRVETYRAGALAMSETNDGRIRMVASCTPLRGLQVVLTDTRRPGMAEWFEQNRTCANGGQHPIFGTTVPPERVDVLRLPNGAAIRFRLATSPLSLSSPAIFDRNGSAYPSACSTLAYQGTRENFEAAVRLAFRNCFLD